MKPLDTARRAIARDVYTNAVRAVHNGDRAGQIRQALRTARFWSSEYPTPVEYSCSRARLRHAAENVDLFARWRNADGHVERLDYGADWHNPDTSHGSAYLPTNALDSVVPVALGIDDGDREAGLVRLLLVADDRAEVDAIIGDHDDTRQGRAYAETVRKRIEDEGVWGVVPQYRLQPGDDWTDTDGAVWGFVGDDWIGCSEDFASCALRGLEDARKEYAEKVASGLTAADLRYAGVVLWDHARAIEDGAEAEAIADRLRRAARQLDEGEAVDLVDSFGRLAPTCGRATR